MKTKPNQSMNLKVERVTPCAPQLATHPPNGAHGMTRLTNPRSLWPRCPGADRSFLLASALFLAAASICFAQPVITNQPQTQATTPGATATFDVGARGTEPLAYQWQKNPGNGFSDLANCTNAALVLTNVQPWDACDYRVVITNLTAGRTSAVARLYVMRPALVTTNVVVDNFDDNKLTGWSLMSNAEGGLIETNQQFKVRGLWRGYPTPELGIWTKGLRTKNWNLAIGQTLEWRVDVVGMNENTSDVVIEPGYLGTYEAYMFIKGRNAISIVKLTGGDGVVAFSCDPVVIKNTNVVLALAMSRMGADVVLTARVLDKDNLNAVLYERRFVDTPEIDRSLTTAEVLALTGNSVPFAPDVRRAPVTMGDVVDLKIFQYNWGTNSTAEVTFDNLELWTSMIPRARYVDVNSTNPTPPFTNWLTAATNIQDAVDVAQAGDEIVVTNGIYATGGRAVGTNILVNRVAVEKSLTVRSVNGPAATVIDGAGTVRCAYVGESALLSGFTLTNGNTYTLINGNVLVGDGAGVFCERFGVVTNCTLSGNATGLGLVGWLGAGGGASGGTLYNCTLSGNRAAYGGGASGSLLYNCTVTDNSAPGTAFGSFGGGVDASTLNNCTLTGNSAEYGGGGASDSTLNNCTLTGNSADEGGGAFASTLYNCTLTGNSASRQGGGGVARGSTLYNCTLTGNSAAEEGVGSGGGASGSMLYNCILYSNTAPSGPNYAPDHWNSVYLNYCSTTPMPTNGFGNITNAPLFVNHAGGNLRLQSNSPCINAGRNAYAPGPTDLDGLPRIVSATVDIGAYEFQGPGSMISYAWLQQFGLPTDGSADATDPDADGHTTWQEWRCQTDPTNALSVLRLLSASPAGTNVTVSWQSVAGVNYFLERSTNLWASPPFALLSPNLPGQPGTTTFTDTNAAPLAPLFYRVGVGN